jgi:hypothetical protein
MVKGKHVMVHGTSGERKGVCGRRAWLIPSCVGDAPRSCKNHNDGLITAAVLCVLAPVNGIRLSLRLASRSASKDDDEVTVALLSPKLSMELLIMVRTVDLRVAELELLPAAVAQMLL